MFQHSFNTFVLTTHIPYFEDISLPPYKDAFLFATLFYLLFIIMNITNCIRLKNKFSWFDFIILLSVNFLYYAAAMTVLSYQDYENQQGLFTASLGVFNLLLTIVFYKQKSIDRNFISLLIGLSLTFISLTAPVQFKGNYVTLFWLAESIILLFLYQRSKIVLLKIASLLLSLLMFAGLCITWVQVYFNNNQIMPVIINKGFITTISVVTGLFIYNRLLQKDKSDIFINTLSIRFVKNVMTAAAIILLYLAGMLELYYQFNTRFLLAPVHGIFIQAYSFAFIIVLLRFFRMRAGFPVIKILLTAFCFIMYLFNIPMNRQVSELLLINGFGNNLFMAHWAAVLLLLWLLIDFILFFVRKRSEDWLPYQSAFSWITSIAITLLLSIEMYQVMLWTNPTNHNDRLWWDNLYHKAGLSILWGLCSFILMWTGMKLNFRTFRIISLTLFTITLVKLFVYDIRNIPPGGKIAAFILLGCLLLVVSFMYQRLKKIIIDNT